MHTLWPCALLMLLTACSTAVTRDQDLALEDPAAAFGALENRLLAAGTVRFDFHVTAEGVIEADLRGRLDIAPDSGIALTASGAFGGKDVELLLLTDGDRYEYGSGTNRTTAANPPHLKEALIIGLTRMGILHNLALLTTAAPPDGADGGVREWVTADSFAGSAFEDAGSPAVIAFEISVAGQRAGSAALALDADGRPVVRHQTVRFPSGEMRVVERYSDVVIAP